MNKKDSLNFLQSCIDKIANASEEDIEMFRMKYNIHCREPLTSSEFEFISPTDQNQCKQWNGNDDISKRNPYCIISLCWVNQK